MVAKNLTSFTKQQRPCHPLAGPLFVAAVALLQVAGLMGPLAAASARSLLSSSAGRATLLQQFSGERADLPGEGGEIRFRANRRHPDVGYISLDPICFACLLPADPAPPEESPAATSAPPPEPWSAPQVAPPEPWSAPQEVSPPEPVPLAANSIDGPSTLVSVVALEVFQAPAPLVNQMAYPVLPPAVQSELLSPIHQAPAPLPILGVSAIFGFSRRLRHRIRATRANWHPEN